MARSKVTFQFSGWLCIIAAFMLMLLPLRWLAAALTAAVFHEFCHIAAVRLCGGKIVGIQLGAGGAKIRMEPMGQGKELICALAGPAGGLLLLCLAHWMPRLAVCAAFHSAYNLLPIYPLDGGRALRCGAELLLPPSAADAVCRWMQMICCTGILVLGFWGTFVLRLGLLPALGGIFILVKTKSVKIPCKRVAQRVQ